MSGRFRPSVWILAALLVVSAAAVIWLGISSARLATAQARLDQGNQALARDLSQLDRASAELKRKLVAAGQPIPILAPPANRDDRETANRLDAIHQLAQLETQIESLRGSISAAESQVREHDDQLASAGREQTRLTASVEELRNKLLDGQRTIDALRAQIKSSDDRLTALEAANRKLAADERSARTRLDAISRKSAELAEIRRRRESLVTALLRRYRELTDHYRALAVRFDRPADHAGLNPGDLSRIQSAISQADEDLRQLGALNAKASAIERARKP